MRTPLGQLLRRSYRLALESMRPGGPSDSRELIALARERARMSRRQFLTTTGSAAAGLVLARCASVPARPATAPGGDEPVLVIGAGIAGLTAAHRLKQAGRRVQVVEAQNRVGGRMYSLRGHFPDNQVVELGGELIDTGHEAIRTLAAELEIELDDLPAGDQDVADAVWFFEGERRSEAEIVDAFKPIAARIAADLATLGSDEISYRTPGGAEALDRNSIADWLDRAGASGWFRRLLDVGYTTEYGLEIAEQSALNLLVMIDPGTETFHIYGDSDERFHVRGGNDRIVQALGRSLENEIETGLRLEAISERPDGMLACEVRRDAAARTLVARHVIVAIPFTLLRSVRIDLELPPAKRAAIAEMGYGTNAKLMVGFASRVWRARHGSNGSVLTDRRFQSTWETSRLQPGAAGILTNFTGGRHGLEIGEGTPAEQAWRLVGDLEPIFPGVAEARGMLPEARFHWPTHPFTLGSYAAYRPGQWTTMHGAAGERVRNLLFAGEHCSLDYQGFMEGGCETGEAAARALLEEAGAAAPTFARQRRRTRRQLLGGLVAIA